MKTETKLRPTPEPWVVRPNTPGHCVRGTENLFSVVGRVRHDEDEGVDVFLTVAENLTQADANLVVSFPKLLAYVKGLVTHPSLKIGVEDKIAIGELIAKIEGRP